MEYIAYVETPYKEKFGIPRQSGLAESTCGEIIFTPKFRNPDAVCGIEEFSHLWLLWEFSRAKQDTFHATVAPPRLGGKEKRGVFATRSPFRPNSIGLSCVKLEKVRISDLKYKNCRFQTLSLMFRPSQSNKVPSRSFAKNTNLYGGHSHLQRANIL